MGEIAPVLLSLNETGFADSYNQFVIERMHLMATVDNGDDGEGWAAWSS